MERLTDKAWRNFDPWECCGKDNYCKRGCHEPGGCTNGCIVPKLYARLAKYEDTGKTPEEILPTAAQGSFPSAHDLIEAIKAEEKKRKSWCVKDVAEVYAYQLEAWENEAYKGGYGADWLENVGEGVKKYARYCGENHETPSFLGLMMYIETEVHS